MSKSTSTNVKFMGSDPKTTFMLYSKSLEHNINKCLGYLPNIATILDQIYNMYAIANNDTIVDGVVAGRKLLDEFMAKYKSDTAIRMALTTIHEVTYGQALPTFRTDMPGKSDFEILTVMIHMLVVVQIQAFRIDEVIGIIAKFHQIKITGIDDFKTMYTHPAFVHSNAVNPKGDTLLIAVCRIIDTIPQFTHIDVDLAIAKLEKVVQTLHDLGSSDTKVNKEGECALMFNLKCINKRINATNVNWATSKTKTTLMMIAVRQNQPARARLLLAQGYDKTLVNFQGRSAYDFTDADDAVNRAEFKQILA